jgi:cell division protein FtsB
MSANPSQPLAVSAMRPSRKPRFLLFFLITLCGLFIYSYTGRQAEQEEIAEDIAALQAKIASAQHQNKALQQELLYVTSPDYVAEAARQDFDYALPGDRVVVVVKEPPDSSTLASGSVASGIQPADAGQPSAPSDGDVLPVWQQWLVFFTTGTSETSSNP